MPKILLFLLYLAVTAVCQAESFKITAIKKIHKKDEKFYFLEKTESGYPKYSLPKSPIELVVETYGGDKSFLEKIKGLTIPRWSLNAEYLIKDNQGEITKVTTFELHGPDYLRTEVKDFSGLLTIKNADSDDKAKIQF